MNTPARSSSAPGSQSPTSVSQRRGFLAKALALLVGGAALAVPAVASVVSFLNPLRQKSQAGKFLRLATLEALPEDGMPRKFPVVMDRTDAWNHFPNEPVGAVFLRRTKSGLEAYQVICPHAGCYVGYDEAKKQFYCPCHRGFFALDGKRIATSEPSPSPRDLDALEVELRNKNEVWVKYQTFRTGTPQKAAEA